MQTLNLFKMESIMNVFENKIKEVQRKGCVLESHNVLSLEDVFTIFKHLNSIARTPHGYRNRLVLSVGLASGFRSSELYSLTLENVAHRSVRGTKCIVFRSTMGGVDGDSKTERGGCAAVSKKPREFLVANEMLLGGSINFYAIIKEYLDFRVTCEDMSNQFFSWCSVGGRQESEGREAVFREAEPWQEYALWDYEESMEERGDLWRWTAFSRDYTRAEGHNGYLTD